MLTVRRSACAVALAAAALVGVTAPAAYAGPAPTPSDDQIAGALQRIGNGSWTEADIDTLKLVPEIGRQVPDPRTAVEEVGDDALIEPIPVDDEAPLQAMAGGCWSATRSTKKTDIFGSTIYNLNNKASWCSNGRVVTQISYRRGWLTNVSSGVYFRGWTVNTSGGINRSTASSDYQAQMEYCVVKYGCYATTHPYVFLDLKANGKHTFSRNPG
jgi:hypothetical protein